MVRESNSEIQPKYVEKLLFMTVWYHCDYYKKDSCKELWLHFISSNTVQKYKLLKTYQKNKLGSEICFRKRSKKVFHYKTKLDDVKLELCDDEGDGERQFQVSQITLREEQWSLVIIKVKKGLFTFTSDRAKSSTENRGV